MSWLGGFFPADPREKGEPPDALPPPGLAWAEHGAIREHEMQAAACTMQDEVARLEEVQKENEEMREKIQSVTAERDRALAQLDAERQDKTKLAAERDRLLALLDAEQRKKRGDAAVAADGGLGEDGGLSGLGLTFHRENPDWSPDGVVIKRVKPRGAAAASQKIQVIACPHTPSFRLGQHHLRHANASQRPR